MSKRNNCFNNEQSQWGSDPRTEAQRSLASKPTGDKKRSQSELPKNQYKKVLTCVTCNGHAYGCNFGVISCTSCKAFFRRNALKLPDKMKCRGNGHCDVTVNIAKRCKKCRLEKCLQSHMRKEWILSDAQKDDKYRKIQENRRLKQLHDQQREAIQKADSITTADENLSLGSRSLLTAPSLSDSERFKIQIFQSTYSASVQLNQLVGVSSYPLIQPLEWTSDLLRVPLFISSMRLITFLKQISEFQQLTEDDRVYLVKLNLIVLSIFHSMFLYDPVTLTYHEPNTTDPFYSGEDWVKTCNGQFHADIRQLRSDFLDLFPSSDIMIKLSYLILIFSDRVSLNDANQYFTIKAQSFSIFNAQNVFAGLLYKYCLNQYGPKAAPMVFTWYVSKVMKLQQLVDEIRFTIRDYVDIRQLSPLMETLLL